MTLQKQLKAQKLCDKIAASVMRGDRVPLEDLQYLAQHDEIGYKMALVLRRPKRNPQVCKSVLPDDDKHPKPNAKDSSENPDSPSMKSVPAESGETA